MKNSKKCNKTHETPGSYPDWQQWAVDVCGQSVVRRDFRKRRRHRRATGAAVWEPGSHTARNDPVGRKFLEARHGVRFRAVATSHKEMDLIGLCVRSRGPSSLADLYWKAAEATGARSAATISAFSEFPHRVRGWASCVYRPGSAGHAGLNDLLPGVALTPKGNGTARTTSRGVVSLHREKPSVLESRRRRCVRRPARTC